jgi:hypothetical protein
MEQARYMTRCHRGGKNKAIVAKPLQRAEPPVLNESCTRLSLRHEHKGGVLAAKGSDCFLGEKAKYWSLLCTKW